MPNHPNWPHQTNIPASESQFHEWLRTRHPRIFRHLPVWIERAI